MSPDDPRLSPDPEDPYWPTYQARHTVTPPGTNAFTGCGAMLAMLAGFVAVVWVIGVLMGRL
jgi:hypothetical protein